MYKETLRHAWIEVDLDNLDFNIKQIKNKIGPDVQLIGVIKADGYGHGSVKTAEILQKNGISSFAVATVTEAVELRDNGFDEEIIVLGLTPGMYAENILEYNITPVVSSLENAKDMAQAAISSGTVISGLIAIDSGMGRIGYRPEDSSALAEIVEISKLDGFNIKGALSHFATSDSADKTYTKQQESIFNDFCEELIAAGVDIPMRTLANSAAIMEMPSTHCDAVRAGIIMYGYYPSDEVDRANIELRPAMSVKASILHLKEIPEGATVSYGQKFTAARRSRIATLALGYADGFPRPYSMKGKVIINGHFAPIAGNICMDQCMVDVTDIPDVKLGDEVIIMGSDGEKVISAEDIAQATGTINYEIICAFGQRLPKVYVQK